MILVICFLALMAIGWSALFWALSEPFRRERKERRESWTTRDRSDSKAEVAA